MNHDFPPTNRNGHETLPAAFYDGHQLVRLYEDGKETHGLKGRFADFDLQDGGQSSVIAAAFLLTACVPKKYSLLEDWEK